MSTPQFDLGFPVDVNLTSANARLQVARQYLSEAQAKIADNISRRLATAGETGARLETAITGPIVDRLGLAQSNLDALHGQVANDFMSRIGLAYAYGSDFGIKPPGVGQLAGSSTPVAAAPPASIHSITLETPFCKPVLPVPDTTICLNETRYPYMMGGLCRHFAAGHYTSGTEAERNCWIFFGFYSGQDGKPAGFPSTVTPVYEFYCQTSAFNWGEKANLSNPICSGTGGNGQIITTTPPQPTEQPPMPTPSPQQCPAPEQPVCPPPDVCKVTDISGSLPLPIQRIIAAVAGPPECGFPTPGSPDWCRCLPQLQQWASLTGEAFFAAVVGGPISAAALTLLAGIGGSNWVGKIVGLDKLIEQVTSVIKTIDWKKVYGFLAGDAFVNWWCNPQQLAGIEMLLTVLRAIKHVRVGWDLVVWATIDLTGTFERVERVLLYLRDSVCAIDFPAGEMAIELWLRGDLSDDDLRCWLKCGGCEPNSWSRIAISRRRRPELVDLYQLLWRKQIGPEQFDSALRGLGYTDPIERQGIQSLSRQIPGPSDLVRFAVRHVWEPKILQRFGYNDEFRPAFQKWIGAQGLDYPITDIDPETGSPFDYTWAQAYWWSHWILASPGQGYAMLQRLRPTGGPNGGPRDPSGEVFSSDDLSLLLRANDYPPFWRKKLEAISYTPIGIRFLRQMVQYGTVDRNETIETLQDNGYRRDKATLIAETMFRQEAERKRKTILADAKGAIETAWSIGTFGDDEYLRFLQDAGLSVNEATQSFGFAVVERNATRAKQVIASVRRDYLDASIDRGEALSRLGSIGVIADRRGEYLEDWDLERAEKGKHLLASELIRYAKEGLLRIPDLIVRLNNLGYQPDDVNLIVEDVQVTIAEKQLKVQLQRIKQLEQLQKQLAQAQQRREKLQLAADREARMEAAAIARAARQAQRDAIAQLKASASPRDIVQWYADGLVSREQAFSRLLELNILPGDATLRLESALLKGQKKGILPEAPSA